MSDQTLQAELPHPPLSATSPRLRLWPGVTLFLVLVIFRTIASYAANTRFQFLLGFVIIPGMTMLALIAWWLFASGLPWKNRLRVVASFVAVSVATMLISGNNFPAMGLIFYGIPVAVAIWVGWLVVSTPLFWSVREWGLLLLFVMTGTVFCLLRIDGMDGSFNPQLAWRWNPRSEDRLLADLQSGRQPISRTPSSAIETVSSDADPKPPETELSEQPGDWPAFRGASRTGELTGVSISTDWEKRPPRELWRRRIGPGWSSMTIIGTHLFTQEQRGDDEFVVCYNTISGLDLWSHHDSTRFNEVVAGAGPRATPTFHQGKIYALGATGRLNCLNSRTGKLIWSRDIVLDTGAAVPQWGFASSPLIANGLVIVFAGGPNGKSMVAYEIEKGKLAWSAGEGLLSYCSPQLSLVCGVEQVLITTDAGLSSFSPSTGQILWHHPWPTEGIARVVQPAMIGGTDVLIGTGLGVGTRRIHVDLKGQSWSTDEVWTVRSFKPYFNDLVILDDHAYGFDGNILMSVNLQDGRPTWRARGYGNGEVLLLKEQKLLLVLTEQGEIALVAAEPAKHQEITRVKGINGKTWNHPVIASGQLFVRNAEEIACFQLHMQAKPIVTSIRKSRL